MSVPSTYRKSYENILANYSWIDLATGTGYIAYYCGQLNNANILTSSSKIGSGEIRNYSITTGTLMETTFVTSFNNHETIGGNANINIPVADLNGSGTMTATVTIYKNSDSIGSSTASKVMTQSADGDNILSQIVAVTQTNFRKGDILGVKIKVVWTEGGVSSAGYVFHDPLGRAGHDSSGNVLEVTTQMIAEIPFRINL